MFSVTITVPTFPRKEPIMVEFIGAAAAIPQLAKYTFSVVNAVPDFMHRMRKAPSTQRQWDDQATLLVSLSQKFHLQPSAGNAISPAILDRLDDDLKRVIPFLRDTTIGVSDSGLAKIRKKFAIVRKEAKINQVLTTVIQRSMLCSQLAVYGPIATKICIVLTNLGLNHLRMVSNRRKNNIRHL